MFLNIKYFLDNKKCYLSLDMINKIERKKMCIVGSQGLADYIREGNINSPDNIGDNEYLYYFFKEGKLGCSDNKPSRHSEISLTKFKRLLENL